MHWIVLLSLLWCSLCVASFKEQKAFDPEVLAPSAKGSISRSSSSDPVTDDDLSDGGIGDVSNLSDSESDYDAERKPEPRCNSKSCRKSVFAKYQNSDLNSADVRSYKPSAIGLMFYDLFTPLSDALDPIDEFAMCPHDMARQSYNFKHNAVFMNDSTNEWAVFLMAKYGNRSDGVLFGLSTPLLRRVLLQAQSKNVLVLYIESFSDANVAMIQAKQQLGLSEKSVAYLEIGTHGNPKGLHYEYRCLSRVIEGPNALESLLPLNCGVSEQLPFPSVKAHYIKEMKKYGLFREDLGWVHHEGAFDLARENKLKTAIFKFMTDESTVFLSSCRISSVDPDAYSFAQVLSIRFPNIYVVGPANKMNVYSTVVARECSFESECVGAAMTSAPPFYLDRGSSAAPAYIKLRTLGGVNEQQVVWKAGELISSSELPD